jgi:sarcosine oxidase subunit gamma
MLDLTDTTCATQLSFRGGGAAAHLAGAVFGVVLPTAPCRAETSAGRTALWLGPDEWLLLSDSTDIAALNQALQDHPAALVDVSHRTLFFKLSGPHAARTINCGCPLDLDLTPFPVGMCTRTILGKAEIILWRTGVEEFQIGVWRSFAAYVRGLLEEGGRSLA